MSTVTGLGYLPVVSNIKTKTIQYIQSSEARPRKGKLKHTTGTTPISSVPNQSEATHMMKHVDPIGALGGLAIMHDVGDKIISGVLVDCLNFFRQVFS